MIDFKFFFIIVFIFLNVSSTYAQKKEYYSYFSYNGCNIEEKDINAGVLQEITLYGDKKLSHLIFEENKLTYPYKINVAFTQKAVLGEMDAYTRGEVTLVETEPVDAMDIIFVDPDRIIIVRKLYYRYFFLYNVHYYPVRNLHDEVAAMCGLAHYYIMHMGNYYVYKSSPYYISAFTKLLKHGKFSPVVTHGPITPEELNAVHADMRIWEKNGGMAEYEEAKKKWLIESHIMSEYQDKH